MGDSIRISWSVLDTANFVSYTLLRRDDSGEPQIEINRFYKKNETAVTDRNVPYSPTVQYQVIGNLSSGKTIISNVVTYSRSTIQPLNIAPYDIIYSDKLLYFFEKSGKISIYNTDGVLAKSIATQATIGYCDFGTYNGKKELYVPRNDGWIFVYDALTLEKITQISTGLTNSCVVYYNNNLYVSTSAWTNRPVKVLSRASGALISETGDFDITRFKRIPNSSLELLEISINIGPVDQDYYKFTADGALVSHSNDRYHGDYPLDHNIFEFFPDGSKYITSSSGAVYNKDMTYLASLPRGNLLFTTFSINQSENLIYAGCQTKNIKVYTVNNFNEVKTLSTKAYPYKIFDTGNQLLCISATKGSTCKYCSFSVTKVVIEKINK
jgi:hypothetical protein